MNPQDFHPPTNPEPHIPQPPQPQPYEAPGQPSHEQPHKERVDRALTVMQPGEVVVATIKRHPIGIIGVYVMVGLILVVVALLALVFLPNWLGDAGNTGSMRAIGTVIFFLLAVLSLIYTLIATVVYWGNSWVVTSDSITQITQSSLFNKQSSQLSLHSLEDVGAEQNGILTHIFNYGLLKAETAGQHGKFVFYYCPNPKYYAKKIIEAHEAFEQSIGHHGEVASQQPAPAQANWPKPPLI